MHADDGWKLLFATDAHGLSESDQLAIYRSLGLTRSADGKKLLVMGGEDAGPARFAVQREDINADGRIEVFVIGGNTFLSGETGSSIWLFTRPAPDGDWQVNLGIPATSYSLLARSDSAYPDLRLSGAGACDVVWRWEGMAYEYHEEIATGPGGCDLAP
ncbi:MAG TPA: hypothetical protein VM011_07475 [Gammaproteobacteria bacterium]|nr:hypothetical protein [Gammaproteobacteria bacterium]